MQISNANINWNNPTGVLGAGGAVYTNTSSFDFDGVDEQITLSTTMTDITSSTMSNFSIATWFKVDVTTGVHTFYEQLGSPTSHLIRFSWWSSNLRFEFNSSTSGGGKNASWTPTTDTWYHVIATYDGTLSATSRCELYINSVKQGGSSSASTPAFGPDWVASPTGTTTLASRVATYRINGHLLDTVLWEETLTQEQVTELYNGNSPYTPTNVGTPTHWWNNPDGDTFSTNWTVNDNIGTANGVSVNMEEGDRVADIPS